MRLSSYIPFIFLLGKIALAAPAEPANDLKLRGAGGGGGLDRLRFHAPDWKRETANDLNLRGAGGAGGVPPDWKRESANDLNLRGSGGGGGVPPDWKREIGIEGQPQF